MKLFFYPFIIFTLCTNSAICQPKSLSNSTSWEEVQKKGNGTITIFWYESKPFIFKDNAGRLTGIEYEIMEGFKLYLKNKYQLDLTIVWQNDSSFENVYFTVRDKKEEGIFGASAFSITPDRQKEVNFAPPYMSDISVFITSKNIPLVTDSSEFGRIFSHLTAITIKGTTYEKDLIAIKEKNGLNFPIRYIPSVDNIQRTISATENAFGFIDLPVYLMELQKNASLQVNRQNLYSIKREGYAFIYTKNSDWAQPVNEYFTTPEFKSEIRLIVGRYLDHNVYQFIEDLFLQTNEDVALLTKEKEIQERDLQGKTKQIEKEAVLRNFLIIAVIIILIFLGIIYLLYQKGNKINIVLSDQKEKIELQRLDIEHQNARLENRNIQLTQLNEEKNNLIKILAHDLRTPINHVHGLAQIFLLENKSLPADQIEIINKIIDAAVRLNKMIGKILDIDAIESNRANIIMESVNVTALLKKVFNSFEKQSLLKNISIIFENTGDDLFIQGDPLYLTEVLENLISNALKFSNPGKKIWVQLKSVGPLVRINIVDEGPGLTPDDQEKLFQKFQRLSTRPTDGERSVGLGLSIVKKYVELMNGQVGCESQVGKGATFFIVFPKA